MLPNAAEVWGPPVTTASSSGSKYFGAVNCINCAVSGVISDILTMTRLPAANAAEAGTTTSCSGKFHGPMMPTTPSGDGTTSAFRPTTRTALISLVTRIHWGTWDLVCSITDTMPSTSVNNVPV